jgi:hypothetical protein
MRSNCIGTDRRTLNGTIRELAKRPSSNLGELWVRLPLVPSFDSNRVVLLTAGCKPVAINV